MTSYTATFTICVNVSVEIPHAQASRKLARETAAAALDQLFGADENALGGWNDARKSPAKVTRIGWEPEGEADVEPA